eukprot:239601_1
MALFQTLLDLYQRNPRFARLFIAVLALYIVKKLYQRRKYSQKLFTTKNEIKNKVILITGCDTGFGNLTALKLSTKYGYPVIATCLKKESVDTFLSNNEFTANNSTSTVMDVSKKQDIERVKQFTIKYLNDTNSVLWGVVNNAGFGIPGQFELVPAELDKLERTVLFSAPLAIIRAFLPLLPGRQNYERITDKTTNNYGRIVNVTSASARMIFGEPRYGPSKAALSYFSHALRMEVSPRFGIWVSAVEPNAYGTNIFAGSKIWGQRVKRQLEENKMSQLMDVYEFDVNKIEKGVDKLMENKMINPRIDEVVECIVHGLISKYPFRRYEPGWNILLKFLVYFPLWMTEPVQLMIAKRVRDEMKKL